MWLNQPIANYQRVNRRHNNYNLWISVDRAIPSDNGTKAALDDAATEGNIYSALRSSRNTKHLTNIKVLAKQGTVTLSGSAFTEAEIVDIYDLIQALDGVRVVKMNFTLAKE